MNILHDKTKESYASLAQPSTRRCNWLDLRAWQVARSYIVRTLSNNFAGLGEPVGIESSGLGVTVVLARKPGPPPNPCVLTFCLWEVLRTGLYQGHVWQHGVWANAREINGLLFVAETCLVPDTLRVSVRLSAAGQEVLDAIAARNPTPTPIFCRALAAKAGIPFDPLNLAEWAETWRHEVEGFKRFFAPHVRFKGVRPLPQTKPLRLPA